MLLWKIGESILIPCCQSMKLIESDLPSDSGRDWAKVTSLKLEKYISVQVSSPYIRHLVVLQSVFDRYMCDCDISLIILKWDIETAVLLSLVIEHLFFQSSPLISAGMMVISHFKIKAWSLKLTLASGYLLLFSNKRIGFPSQASVSFSWCGFDFVHRMWWEPSGQHWKLLLAWVP